MNTLLKQTLVVSVLSAMMAGTAFAEPKESPDAFVKKVADGVIKKLTVDHAKLQNNPAAAKEIVRVYLDPYLDAQGFSRIVMGTYVNSSTAEQRKQFERNLRETLIANYGTAFAKFTNQTYTIRPYRAVAGQKPVVTLDFNNKGEKTPVSFQLIDKGDQWKVRNMKVAGIDLGLQFRNQFAATVKSNGDNLDKAIANFKPNADAAMDKKK